MLDPTRFMTFLRPSGILAFLAHFHSVTAITQFEKFGNNALYATKTAYDDSFNAVEKTARQSVWTDTITESGVAYHAVQVNMVIRHGTRYPSSGDIEKAEQVMERFRSRINHPDLEELSKWKVPFTQNKARALAPLGNEELQNIASRLASGMHKLFSLSDIPKLLFQSSNRARAVDSAKAFIRGLTDRNPLLKNPEPDIKIRNDLLRYYDNCPKHTLEVEESKGAIKEFNNFKKGPEVNKVAENIQRRLNIEDEILHYSDLKAIYAMTSTEVHVFGSSIWHKVWSQEDLETMEYAADLKTYWRKGYGYTLNYEQSCPLLLHIIHEIELAINNPQTGFRQGIFRFGHSETLVPLLSLLGLFRDEEAPAANNFQQMKDRQFRASKISPFAANIAFILYKSETKESGDQENYYVKLLVNEKPTHFPFCHKDLCPYNLIREHYKKYIESCDLKSLCKVSKSAKDEL